MYYVCFSLLFDARVAWRAYEWVKVWEINLTSPLRLRSTPGLCAVSSHPGDGTDGTDINGLFTLRGPYLIQMLSNCLHALAIDWRALLPSHTGKGGRMRLSKRGAFLVTYLRKQSCLQFCQVGQEYRGNNLCQGNWDVQKMVLIKLLCACA